MKLPTSALSAVLVLLSATVCRGEPPPPPPTEKVVRAKELLIMNSAVLTSPRATAKDGPWHIRTALGRIAGVGADVDQYARAWFKTWATNVTVPGSKESFAVRPWVEAEMVKAWEGDRIKLIAIVNRIDLAKFPDGNFNFPPLSLGEGRFVYEIRKEDGSSLPVTLIFEYGLPGPKTWPGLISWATRWHALGKHQSFDEAYLKDLQAITDDYSATGTLNQIRTNEFFELPEGQAGPRRWELREFHLAKLPAIGLVQMPVGVTPDIAHDNSQALADFIKTNEAAILQGKHESFTEDLKAAVSPVASSTFQWKGGPGAPARASFIVSFNTCSGCHAGDTKTLFQHIGLRASTPSEFGPVSPFLAGKIVLDQKLPTKDTTDHDEMAIREMFLVDYLTDLSGRDDPVFKAEVKARANRVH